MSFFAIISAATPKLTISVEVSILEIVIYEPVEGQSFTAGNTITILVELRNYTEPTEPTEPNPEPQPVGWDIYVEEGYFEPAYAEETYYN